jgi:hypothetical protein
VITLDEIKPAAAAPVSEPTKRSGTVYHPADRDVRRLAHISKLVDRVARDGEESPSGTFEFGRTIPSVWGRGSAPARHQWDGYCSPVLSCSMRPDESART